MADPSQGSFEDVFVARQPIFDRKGKTWGYELLFRRAGGDATAVITNPDAATAQVIADGFSTALSSLDDSSKVLINFPANLIARGTPFALPKDRCIIEILETVTPEPKILTALTELKQAGYTLALDDYIGDPGYEPLVQLADIVKVEVMNQPEAKIVHISQKLKQQNITLLAEKVEDQKILKLTHGLGYAYFQGYFFSKPEIIPGRKISSSQLTKLKLLQELSREELEFKDIAQVVSNDAGLSYRLLQFINSAAFRRAREIQSVAQAMTMLGVLAVKQWLTAVIISDMNPSPKAHELCYLSAQRGKYLELLGQKCAKQCYSNETLFMLGLFSKLDALLDQPMAKVVEQLPLNEDLRNALTGQPSPALEWVEHAHHVETGNWESALNFLNQHGLEPSESAILHAKASTWAKSLLEGAAEK